MVFKIFTAAVVLAIFIACLMEVSTGGNDQAWAGIIGVLTILGLIIYQESKPDL